MKLEASDKIKQLQHTLKQLNSDIADKVADHFSDITESVNDLEKEVEALKAQLDQKDREIKQVMITDSLTNLYNRYHLVTVLEREIARSKRYGHPLALMMMEIDDFRMFNDSYGQSAGDKMLSFAGNLIHENIRKFDRAFRYGGKEFVVVMPETDTTMAFFAAERIRNKFQNRVFSVMDKDSGEEENVSRTMSIGITYSFAYDTKAIIIDRLFKQAETAVSMAKQNGGNVSLNYKEQETPAP
ncbi:MAG: diguanylate cyclase [Nitrospiraceae bacterium]|nr:MAG: diguanylate cyclase [Nitrospiraceae bacterium]